MIDIIPQDDTPLKQCANPACKQWFPATLEYFHKDRNAHDKLATRCKPCKRASNNYAHAHPRPKEVLPDGYKRCTRCEKPKLANLENFHAQKRGLYGLCSICKDCRNIEKNAEEPRLKRLQYSRNHREEHKLYCQQYSQANKEELRLYRQQYKLAHSQEYRLYLHEYRQANPDKMRVYSHNYRARKLATGGTYTTQDIQKQYANQKGKCYYCGKKLGKIYHVDHVVPVSRGGSNDPSNLVIACPMCNLSKNARLPHEWPEGNRLL